MTSHVSVSESKYETKERILCTIRYGDPRCIWVIHVVTGLVQLVDTLIPHVANLKCEQTRKKIYQ